MNKTDLKIYPMGGVAEIGSNITIFEFENEILAIDYGILFPYEDFFDINYLIVDTQSLKKSEKPITLFITHGHEDHIGAVVHFLQEFPRTKLYAPRLATELIKAKIFKAGFSFEIETYTEDLEVSFDEYTLRPVHVTHSIPDTFGVILHKQNELAFLFISDFKYDLNPCFEKPFNTDKIKQYFTKAKRSIAFLDSTNILNPDKTLSENDILEDLEKIIARKQRTFITLFASNIYRVHNLLLLAKKHQRKVCFIGRSLHFYLESAHNVGILNKEDFPIIELDAIENYTDPNLMFIVTGSQGEHLGATKRISNGDQKHITLSEKDIFVFSSKAIPGNEKKIYRLINKLSDSNVEVITSRDMQVHASGHPGQKDLAELLKEIQPTDLIPIHGETYFLRKHIDFAAKNFPQIKTHFITNFDLIMFKNGEMKIIDNAPTDPIIIHGNNIPIEREKISERRKLACNGLIVVTINHKSKNINITTNGLPNEFARSLPDLRELAHYTVFQEFKNRDYDYVTEKVRIKTRNFANGKLGYKPITIVSMV